MNVIKRLRRRAYKKSGGGNHTGNKCKTFTWHCIVCESHRYKEIHGGFANSFEELWEWAQPFRKAHDA